jgi:NAD(P)-dependent dehydrogenase (short-subunit alcohol dehydrogenase family)
VTSPSARQLGPITNRRGNTAVTKRRAIVTGGVSGLGLASSKRLREDNVEVITVDISPDADIRIDISDAAAVEAMAKQVGPIDILVNSAGILGPFGPLWETKNDEWDRTFAVNLNGTFYTCKAFVPGMIEKGWGRIVNVASIAAKEGNPKWSAYSASKAAVIGMTKSLGKELATAGVLVNAIAPSVISTPMADVAPKEGMDRIRSLIPMQRFGRPEEFAELVLFLATERVGFSTGAVYDISGGRATY